MLEDSHLGRLGHETLLHVVLKLILIEIVVPIIMLSICVLNLVGDSLHHL